MSKKMDALPTPEELEFYRSKVETGAHIGCKQLAKVFAALDAALDRAKQAEEHATGEDEPPLEKSKMEYVGVPVEAAKKVADVYCKNQVIIITFDGKHHLMHCTTYGKSISDSAIAAAAGAKLKAWLGFPEEYCNVLPERVLKAVAEYEAAEKG